ncbi:hypothetical protein J4573_03480 [Actinomadura barringtoniae]|uniref:SGNH hydrolase-type esterase domain-containing protein n=1 Tax=Actinomadura barringtoniae TaxID=1427535 RepID=A0A939T4N5_9ACTN|nr:GDSL-type esterase/lipase family protein [Actinomadura barringtoniae]MBO2446137.1 hypothetical protein [Actinomadura barringtoniae]
MNERTLHQPGTDLDNPTEWDVSLMVVGDSISHGSSGDWTWRYRFWKHLRASEVKVDFVGPKKHLDNIRTEEVGDGDLTYADPGFDRDHDAQWGQPYKTAKDTIGEHVAAHRPDFVLVLLGINDIVWFGIEPPEFESNLREFIANARAGNPEVRLILGTILDTRRAAEDHRFDRRVMWCNNKIRALAAELRTPRSPIEVADTAVEFAADLHTWDGTHPNPNGEVRIAAAFADVLAQRFGVGRTYPRPYPDIAPIPDQAKAPSAGRRRAPT